MTAPLDVGCHAVDLLVRERTFRNPTPSSDTVSQIVCVEEGVGTDPGTGVTGDTGRETLREETPATETAGA